MWSAIGVLPERSMQTTFSALASSRQASTTFSISEPGFTFGKALLPEAPASALPLRMEVVRAEFLQIFAIAAAFYPQCLSLWVYSKRYQSIHTFGALALEPRTSPNLMCEWGRVQ